jgi:hypothetical protein
VKRLKKLKDNVPQKKNADAVLKRKKRLDAVLKRKQVRHCLMTGRVMM